MDKNTLSNYGWIVICILVISVMLALATPFGEFVAGGFRSTYEGLTSTMNAALEKGLGVDLNGDGEVGGNTGSGETGDETDEITSLTAPRIELRDDKIYIYDVDKNAQRLFVTLNGSDKAFYFTTAEGKTDVITGVDLEGEPILYLSMMSEVQEGTNEVSVFVEYGEGENIITSPNSDTIYFDGTTFEEVVAPSDCEHLNKEYISIDNDNHMVICNDCSQTVVDSEAHNIVDGMCDGCKQEVANPNLMGTATFNDGVTLTWDELKLEENGTKYGYNAVAITDTSIGDYAFSSCTSLTSITIPDSVMSIGNDAFVMCANLTSITIPDSVMSIGNNTFVMCTSLTSITIPNGVTTLYGTFDGCTNLTSVTIPDSVTNIDYFAFSECASLTSITIPNSVTSIGDYAFGCCTNLTSITIPDSVTSIGHRVFDGCTNLTSVKMPDSVTDFGQFVFNDCASLTSITIPSGVTELGYTFGNCTSLTSITIPNSVTKIYSGTFAGCNSLATVYFQGSEAEWNTITIGFENDALENANVIFAK